MRNRIHLLRFLPVVAACILCAGNTPGETPNRGGSLVLNPASYQEVAPVLAPTTSLAFEFDTDGGLPPKMIVDATTQCLGVHDSLTDWNVWCFGEVRIPANVTITVGADGSQRLGAPIAILAHGDIISSATWNLKGKGWKGGTGANPGYGPAGGLSRWSGGVSGSGGGHALFGQVGTVLSGGCYNRGAPDGALHNLFTLYPPLGSGGGGAEGMNGGSGGGAVQLTALGSLVIAGSINVSGNAGAQSTGDPDLTTGAGSGGTVILAAGRAFSDNQAEVRVDGGDAYGGEGGPGRIAIYANRGQPCGLYHSEGGHQISRPGGLLYPGTLFFSGIGGFPFSLETGTRSITLQGVVNNEKGHPVTGKFDARFRLYDAATSGSLLMEVLCELEVKQGAFSKEIEVSEALFRDHNTVYVEVWIDTNKNGLDPGDRFADRFKITSVPFAENANKLDGAK